MGAQNRSESLTGAPKRNTRRAREMGAQTKNSSAPRLGAPTQRKARPQDGRPNATQGDFARWSPKRKSHPQRKRPHKGALGKKTSWMTDKNQFWFRGRYFNTACPRLGDQGQGKASWQEGHANATRGQLARWVPKRRKRCNETHKEP